MFCRALAIVVVLTALGANRDTRAATHHVRQLSAIADDRNDGSESSPWKTIGRAARAVGPGDVVVIDEGVYCETVVISRGGTIDRPIRFAPAPGAIVVVSGADRIARWVREPGGGNIFSASWRFDFIPWNSAHSHPNDEYHALIGRCEQVFVAGRAQRQVLDRQQLAPGTFFVDLRAKKLFARSDDDRDLTDKDLNCQASTRGVLWDCRGSHVITSGLRFRYAANVAQRGAAIFSGKFDQVEDCTFERTNSVGVSFLADDITVRRCTFQDNGQLGFSADKAHRLSVTDCISRGNNTKNFDHAWEAGGAKIVLSRGAIIERSVFENNHGIGLWFDMGNEDSIVRNCLIAKNEDAGLFYEISYGLHAHDNVIVGNGLANTPGAWGASSGISLSSSPGCVIERNLIAGNREGFNFREAPRTTPRIGAARHAPQEPIWNHDEVIRRNIFAGNRDVQVRGWFDVSDESHWPVPLQSARVQNESPPLSLESLKLDLSANVYCPTAGADLFCWGASWNRHEKFQSLEDVRNRLGLENASVVKEISFDVDARDFRLPANLGAALEANYPRGDVPGVRLGVMKK